MLRAEPTAFLLSGAECLWVGLGCLLRLPSWLEPSCSIAPGVVVVVCPVWRMFSGLAQSAVKAEALEQSFAVEPPPVFWVQCF